jgi:D-alanine-D-alanine ligase
MRIGLTYDLRDDYLAEGYSPEETAEFDSMVTIDGLDDAVRAQGHQTDRIGNARRLVERLAGGDRWDLVFNIAEGLHGLGREAQVPAILDVYGIPYTFADPLVAALCLHKGFTKTVVRQAGVPTPDFALVQRPEDIAQVQLPFPLFAKPVGEGTGKGIGPNSKIRDAAALRTVCLELLERFRQPVLVETFLPGRELTIGIVGTGPAAAILGTMEILLRPQAEPDVYSFVNKEQSDDLVDYDYPTGERDERVRLAQQTALDAYRALGCRDAGRVDIRCDAAGVPNFMEVNPLAGLHPTHSDLPMIGRACGVSYGELIGRILQSAAQRVSGQQSAFSSQRSSES